MSAGFTSWSKFTLLLSAHVLEPYYVILNTFVMSAGFTSWSKLTLLSSAHVLEPFFDFGIFWIILEKSGIFWYDLEYFGIFWNI